MRMNAEPPTMIPISAVLLIFEVLPLSLAVFGDADCRVNDEETLGWTEPASFVIRLLLLELISVASPVGVLGWGPVAGGLVTVGTDDPVVPGGGWLVEDEAIAS